MALLRQTNYLRAGITWYQLELHHCVYGHLLGDSTCGHVNKWSEKQTLHKTHSSYILVISIYMHFPNCKACFVLCCLRFMHLRKRWCFLLGRRQQHFGCLAFLEKKTLALCSPPQMDSLHQRKTMFLKCYLLLHSPSPLQKEFIQDHWRFMLSYFLKLFLLPFPHSLIASLFRYFSGFQGVS